MKIINKEENMFELVVNDKDIDKLISKLNELKQSREHIHINVDKSNDVLIHHESSDLLK